MPNGAHNIHTIPSWRRGEGPLPPRGLVRFVWVRFGSVQFGSVQLSRFSVVVVVVGYLALGRRLLCSPLLLLLPLALTWHCLLCNHLHPRNDSFYYLLPKLLLFFSTYTMEICMFPITALKSQPNSYSNNYGTIESCCWSNIIIIVIIVVLNDGPQSVLSVSRVLLRLQCKNIIPIENENTHGVHALSTKQKAGKKKKKKRQPNAFFHLQSTHSWYLGFFLQQLRHVLE